MRLFFALWPADGERAAAAQVQAGVAWPPGAKLVKRENLHLTLHFLGHVDADRVPALRAAAEVSAAPVSLTFDRFTVWPSGIAVLEPSAMSPPLASLHRALAARLKAAGFELEGRPYRPHITLARRGDGALSAGKVGAISWRASSFALMQSAGGRYTVLQEWPLRG